MDGLSDQLNKLLSTACHTQQLVTQQSLLVDDLGFDSLGLIELTVAIEDQFDILIPASAIPQINTVADLANLIQNSVITQPAVPELTQLQFNKEAQP
ncbi:hypothetical protein MNBD_GAMMA12-2820 [hydrothermal vent metagenome]|uniref:Carrier domain-containing protein n=1 Tax=hydrothermal vent metagenome TaxID=652676 RepID=A0A3B0YXM7_9ZZZZ